MRELPEGLTPTVLRQLASWFDTYDRMAESYIAMTRDLVSAERVEELLKIVRGKGVQDDLRRWADDIEFDR